MYVQPKDGKVKRGTSSIRKVISMSLKGISANGGSTQICRRQPSMSRRRVEVRRKSIKCIHQFFIPEHPPKNSLGQLLDDLGFLGVGLSVAECCFPAVRGPFFEMECVRKIDARILFRDCFMNKGCFWGKTTSTGFLKIHFGRRKLFQRRRRKVLVAKAIGIVFGYFLNSENQIFRLKPSCSGIFHCLPKNSFALFLKTSAPKW